MEDNTYENIRTALSSHSVDYFKKFFPFEKISVNIRLQLYSELWIGLFLDQPQ